MKERIDLVEALSSATYDHAVICTFTFEPEFFESFCLDRLDALSTNANVTVVLDQQTYDSMLTGPPSSWPRLANVRYLLHPVRAVGTFHPKLFLLVKRDRGLLVVGSANFTKPGLTTNAELVGVYDFVRDDREAHVGLFRQAFAFLEVLAARWPSDALRENLNDIVTSCPWITPQHGALADERIWLLHNVETSLWTQIRHGIGPSVDEVYVLSPFFDASPAILDRVQTDFRPRRTVIYTQNGVTTMTEAWLGHPLVRDGSVSIEFIAVDDEDHAQHLHAKGLAIVHGKEKRLVFGSANFTSPALLATASHGNVETVVVVDALPKSWAPPDLFDPCETARTEPLRPGKRDETAGEIVSSLTLSEASRTNDRVTCRLSTREPLSEPSMTAVLLYADGASVRLRLSSIGPDTWRAICDPTTVRLSAGVATVVHVEAAIPGDDVVLRSNPVLLINLQDIDTGQSARSARRIREAQRSASQFLAVLEELLRDGDQDSLKAFLTYCDIHVLELERPFALRPARSRWDDACQELRVLGERNLRTYATLHDAILGFCSRHLRRLTRQHRRPTLVGLPSHMHIALAIAHVLSAQVELLLVGLEATSDALDASDWGGHRERLDRYLALFGELVKTVDGSYLPALLRRYEDPAVRAAIAPDLEPLRDVFERFLRVRDRVEAARATNLRVRTPRGNVVPFVNDAEAISAGRWERWAKPVRVAAHRCETWMRDAS